MAKIVRFHQLGGPEIWKIEEVPAQEPKTGEVRLRVQPMGLNRSESMFMHGYWLEQDEMGDAVRNCRAAASRNPPSFESEGACRSWLARILIDETCALIRRKQFSLVRSPQESSYQPRR